MSPALRRGLGLGLIAAATLTAEVVLTRLLSAGLFHHLAFVVVSTAMFGTAAGGLAVTLRPGLRAADPDRVAAGASLAFAVGLPSLFAASQQLPLEPMALVSEPAQAVWLCVVYLALAAPFAASGLAIAVVLDRHARQAPRLYAADLAGASAGCFAALAALHAGPSGLYGASAVAVAAAAAFGARFRVAAGAGALLAGAALVAPLPLHISASKVTKHGEPFAEVLADPARTRATRWGPLGRVDLVRFGAGQRRLILDAGVAAVRVPPLRARFAPSDVTLPYELRPDTRVLVIGAGAGWEVAEALQLGAGWVDAVEINPDVAAEAPARLRRHPRVGWHITDGRSFLHRPGEPYGAILLIHTISNAATAAGAMRLAEDYLLTVEALGAMLDRLGDGGVLLLTRPEAQIPALVWNLRHAGVEAPQVWSWTESLRDGFYGAVMVKARVAWTPAESARIRDRLAARRLVRLFDPGAEGPPADALARRIDALLRGPPVTGRALGPDDDRPAPVDRPPRVATDDRPYFHQHRPWSELRLADLRVQPGRSRLALEERPLAEASLVLLLVQTTAMAAVVLLLPLLWDPKRRRLDTARVAIYFGALGLGFMLAEVALVQRLGLLLGSPTLAFAVVFAGLLAGTASGSALSGRWPRPRHAPAATAGAVLVLALTVPGVTDLGLPQPLAIRVLLALLTVFGVGLFMGLPFPLGLRRVGGGRGAAAWALAFNGVASVAGTGVAMIIGAQLGLTASLAAAAGAYGIAWAVPPRGAPPDAA